MASPVKIDLGAFAAGEVPPILSHTFTDFDGVVVDLTGFTTLAMNIEAIPDVTGPLGGGLIVFDGNGSDGIVNYTWTDDDMEEPSGYTAQMWVSNGTNKYASDLIIYNVYDGPGDAP